MGGRPLRIAPVHPSTANDTKRHCARQAPFGGRPTLGTGYTKTRSGVDRRFFVQSADDFSGVMDCPELATFGKMLRQLFGDFRVG